MALPTLIKTWQFNVNQIISGVDVATQNNIFWLAVKNSLIGFASGAWVVWGSSDGVGNYGNNDAVDRWATIANLVHATAGSNHSWIVIRNTVTGMSICFDLAPANTTYGTVVISWAAGFSTNGTATARPTATDEYAIVSGVTLPGDVNYPYRLHMMHSSDGECTRIVLHRNNISVLIGIFDKMSAAVGVTNAMALWCYQTFETLAYNYLTNNVFIYAKVAAAAPFGMYMTCEGTNLGLASNLLSYADDDTGEWPMFPIGLVSVSGSHRGRKGAFYDLWWGSVGVGVGSTYPNDATRLFAQFGAMIFPWNGSTPVTG